MTIAFPILAFCAFCWRRMLRYLHVFQQEDYYGYRFLSWLVKERAFDRRLSIVLAVAALVASIFPHLLPSWAWDVLVAACLAGFAAREVDPRKQAKKKLVLTKRATRIVALALALCVLFAFALAFAFGLPGWLLAVQAIPLLLVLANYLLAPFESLTQKKYWSEAKRRLSEVNPKVVGITGSFGKTTVKTILGHILELNSNAQITPGSVNSPMGIARFVRENLRTGCRFFVVEMGAYAVGSIARCCALTPPHYGVLTAIGEAHYERFKSLDAVARAKFELAEAVLQNAAGIMVIHDSVLQQTYAKDFVNAARSNFVICGEGPEADVRIRNVAVSANGTSLDVLWKDRTYHLAAPLLGPHQAANIALAFTTAAVLGVAPERAIIALRSTPQVKHRLELKSFANGATLIDDSYNSNPVGFASALEVLSQVKKPGGRAILVTPGMVEMGPRHDELHRQIGSIAAQKADIALIVRGERIPSFAEGFKSNGQAKDLEFFGSYGEAYKWLQANSTSSDVILVENDLPDLYESDIRF